ncbi:beta-glucoside-specific PTS transporter subunit IIABC [Peribacillus loiseleuriae]|uniref:PTS beta-glucoside transporter subunit IIABC n=1 Tax=Peribacillus loiseleuriae TaxID=1679170 RepID=A0A0K9GST3_9BACI|nr:beta-glucoside-specific PTS transporter subunit IIABC [Peribacillus loiseleuriae]KMY49695.1 PTS beta-glucoside transporter subunit IIABC [Peribacillus loiseleuriae]
MKFEKEALQIIEFVGGRGNVVSLVHCATRLRFKLKDSKQTNKKELEKMKDVLSVVNSGGQYQVVIGNKVTDYYDTIVAELGLAQESKDDGKGEKVSLISRVFEVISGAFSPLIPALAGAGMIKALLTVLTTFEWMSDQGTTYAILSSAGNAVFYFLPIFLGITLSIKMGANPYVGGVIGAALLEPNFTGLIESEKVVTLFGLPVTPIDYASSVFPIFVAIFIYYFVYKGLSKVIMKDLRLFLEPMLSLLIMVPLTILLFGPMGTTVGDVLAGSVMWLIDKSPLIAGIVLGAGMPFMVIFGLHWGFTPITLQNLATMGGDPIEGAAVAAVFAEIGIAIGLFLKAKKHSQLRSLAGPTAITGILAGVTEPIVYGIIMRYKRTIPIVAIAGGVGGAILGGLGVTCNAYVFHNVFSMPVYSPFIGYLFGIGAALVLGAVLAYFFGLNKEEMENMEKEIINTKSDTELETERVNQPFEEVISPMTGKQIKLSEVEDKVFASGAVGQGLAIYPEQGKVWSPVDGIVTTVFPSKHAIGITSNGGAEILIHVGLNTVSLDGKYYETHVQNGDKIKKGDLLVTFDIEKIKSEGFSMVTPVIVTNSAEYKAIVIEEQDLVTNNNIVMKLIKE